MQVVSDFDSKKQEFVENLLTKELGLTKNINFAIKESAYGFRLLATPDIVLGLRHYLYNKERG